MHSRHAPPLRRTAIAVSVSIVVVLVVGAAIAVISIQRGNAAGDPPGSRSATDGARPPEESPASAPSQQHQEVSREAPAREQEDVLQEVIPVVRAEPVQDMTTREALQLWQPPGSHPRADSRGVATGVPLRVPQDGRGRTVLRALQPRDLPASHEDPLTDLVAPWAREVVLEYSAAIRERHLRAGTAVYLQGNHEDVLLYLLVHDGQQNQLMVYLHNGLITDLELIPLGDASTGGTLADFWTDVSAPPVVLP